MAATLLQPDHQIGQLLGGGGPAVSFPTDFEVLAEHAAQVALAEEDRARALLASQAVFLAVMRKGAADDCAPAGATVRLLAAVAAPIGVTAARTERAIGKGIDRSPPRQASSPLWNNAR